MGRFPYNHSQLMLKSASFRKAILSDFRPRKRERPAVLHSGKVRIFHNEEHF
jgi:hypothetical protein